MARKQRDGGGGGYNWMDTYGDLVTLLLTFFIMLFAMSTVDAEKWEILIESFQKKDNANTAQIVLIRDGEDNDVAPAVGETEPIGVIPDQEPTEEMIENLELSQLAQAIQSFIEENELQDDIKVESEGENSVYMSFNNDLFFDGDSYALRTASYEILDYLGALFKAVEDEVLIYRINGHTAAIPYMEDYAVNDWDLSAMRANRVATYFEENTGLIPKKLMTNGYGKNHPVASNDTEEGRAANRRVDIQILGNDFDQSDPQELLSILNQTLNVGIYDESVPEPAPVVPPENIPSGDGNTVQTPVGVTVDPDAISPEPTPVLEEPTDAEIEAALAALEQEAAGYIP